MGYDFDEGNIRKFRKFFKNLIIREEGQRNRFALRGVTFPV